MQVRHRFASVGAVIKYEAKATLREAQPPGDFGGFHQQMTEQGLVLQPRFGYARNGFLRDQKDVRGRLWGNVVKGDDQVVFIDDPGRNFASDNLLEKGSAHNFNCAKFANGPDQGPALRYSTMSAHASPAASTRTLRRRNSMIWSRNCSQRGLQRCAPSNRFTQARRP